MLEVVEHTQEAGTEPPTVLPEQPPVIAQPRPREEFWHTYQFGQKGPARSSSAPPPTRRWWSIAGLERRCIIISCSQAHER